MVNALVLALGQPLLQQEPLLLIVQQLRDLILFPLIPVQVHINSHIRLVQTTTAPAPPLVNIIILLRLFILLLLLPPQHLFQIPFQWPYMVMRSLITLNSTEDILNRKHLLPCKITFDSLAHLPSTSSSSSSIIIFIFIIVTIRANHPRRKLSHHIIISTPLGTP